MQRPPSDVFRPRLPLDPFSSVHPHTPWSVPPAHAIPPCAPQVILVLGDPAPADLLPLLTSAHLASSLLLIATHAPPAFIPAALFTSSPSHSSSSPSPSTSKNTSAPRPGPTIRVLRLRTPLAPHDGGALRLVALFDKAQPVVEAWRSGLGPRFGAGFGTNATSRKGKARADAYGNGYGYENGYAQEPRIVQLAEDAQGEFTRVEAFVFASAPASPPPSNSSSPHSSAPPAQSNPRRQKPAAVPSQAIPSQASSVNTHASYPSPAPSIASASSSSIPASASMSTGTRTPKSNPKSKHPFRLSTISLSSLSGSGSNSGAGAGSRTSVISQKPSTRTLSKKPSSSYTFSYTSASKSTPSTFFTGTARGVNGHSPRSNGEPGAGAGRAFDAILNFLPRDTQDKALLKNAILVSTLGAQYLGVGEILGVAPSAVNTMPMPMPTPRGAPPSSFNAPAHAYARSASTPAMPTVRGTRAGYLRDLHDVEVERHEEEKEKAEKRQRRTSVGQRLSAFLGFASASTVSLALKETPAEEHWDSGQAEYPHQRQSERRTNAHVVHVLPREWGQGLGTHYTRGEKPKLVQSVEQFLLAFACPLGALGAAPAPVSMSSRGGHGGGYAGQGQGAGIARPRSAFEGGGGGGGRGEPAPPPSAYPAAQRTRQRVRSSGSGSGSGMTNVEMGAYTGAGVSGGGGYGGHGGGRGTEGREQGQGALAALAARMAGRPVPYLVGAGVFGARVRSSGAARDSEQDAVEDEDEEGDEEEHRQLTHGEAILLGVLDWDFVAHGLTNAQAVGAGRAYVGWGDVVRVCAEDEGGELVVKRAKNGSGSVKDVRRDVEEARREGKPKRPPLQLATPPESSSSGGSVEEGRDDQPPHRHQRHQQPPRAQVASAPPSSPSSSSRAHAPSSASSSRAPAVSSSSPTSASRYDASASYRDGRNTAVMASSASASAMRSGSGSGSGSTSAADNDKRTRLAMGGGLAPVDVGSTSTSSSGVPSTSSQSLKGVGLGAAGKSRPGFPASMSAPASACAPAHGAGLISTSTSSPASPKSLSALVILPIPSVPPLASPSSPRTSVGSPRSSKAAAGAAPSSPKAPSIQRTPSSPKAPSIQRTPSSPKAPSIQRPPSVPGNPTQLTASPSLKRHHRPAPPPPTTPSPVLAMLAQVATTPNAALPPVLGGVPLVRSGEDSMHGSGKREEPYVAVMDEDGKGKGKGKESRKEMERRGIEPPMMITLTSPTAVSFVTAPASVTASTSSKASSSSSSSSSSASQRSESSERSATDTSTATSVSTTAEDKATSSSPVDVHEMEVPLQNQNLARPILVTAPTQSSSSEPSALPQVLVDESDAMGGGKLSKSPAANVQDKMQEREKEKKGLQGAWRKLGTWRRGG